MSPSAHSDRSPVPPLLALWEIHAMRGSPRPDPPPNHHKNPKPVSLPCSLNPLWTRKPHHSSNKPFHPLLMCVWWCHQPQHPSQIWAGSPSCFCRVTTTATENTEEVNYTVNQLGLVDISKRPPTAEHVFFLCVHGPWTKIGHILGHENEGQQGQLWWPSG